MKLTKSVKNTICSIIGIVIVVATLVLYFYSLITKSDILDIGKLTTLIGIGVVFIFGWFNKAEKGYKKFIK